MRMFCSRVTMIYHGFEKEEEETLVFDDLLLQTAATNAYFMNKKVYLHHTCFTLLPNFEASLNVSLAVNMNAGIPDYPPRMKLKDFRKMFQSKIWRTEQLKKAETIKIGI